MKPFLSKEMLENCIVDLSERYSLSYSYEPTGIKILVAKTNNEGITFVLEDFVPCPSPDEIGY